MTLFRSVHHEPPPRIASHPLHSDMDRYVARAGEVALAPKSLIRLPRSAHCNTRHPGCDGQRRLSPHRLLTRSEEHTSELQSLMRISYAVFCLKKNISNIILT